MIPSTLSRLRQITISLGDCAPANLAAYTELLERLYGFYAPLEVRLSGYAHWTPLAFARRRKAPLLGEDLWNLYDGRVALDALPLCAHLPDVSRLPAALGALYVMESLTLDGDATCRRLASARLGLTPSHGLRFFHGYGLATGTMWQSFASLVAASSSGATDGLMADAAEQTAARLSDWLSAPAHRDVCRRNEISYAGYPRLTAGVC